MKNIDEKKHLAIAAALGSSFTIPVNNAVSCATMLWLHLELGKKIKQEDGGKTYTAM